MSTQIQTPQIKITQKAEINEIFQDVYDARTLHAELQSKKQFSDWIKNRLQDFVETLDFISFTPKSEKPLGGRPSTEYLLTIDTAKDLSMMEQTDIGKKVRNAFIQAEKELRKLQQQVPQIKQLSRMEILQIAMESEKRVLELESTVKEKDIIIEAKDTQIESAKNLFKQVADKTGCIKFKACASLLNITESELKGVLRSNKWIYLNKLFPTTEARMNGYVKNLPEEFKIQTKDGKTLNKQKLSFFITERGYYNLLEKVAGITMN